VRNESLKVRLEDLIGRSVIRRDEMNRTNHRHYLLRDNFSPMSSPVASPVSDASPGLFSPRLPPVRGRGGERRSGLFSGEEVDDSADDPSTE